MGNRALILVDTSVLLEDPEVLVRIRRRGGLPFLTSTVLDELDYNKDLRKRANQPTNNAQKLRAAENAKNGQLIFREPNNSAPSRLTEMPTGGPLVERDVLTQFGFKDGPVFLIGRQEFRARSNNDAKIIEWAKDYNMVLITRDKGMKVRAEALGVKVTFWTGPEGVQNGGSASNGRPASQRTRGRRAGSAASGPRPFAICTSPIGDPDVPLRTEAVPGTGDTVKLGRGQEFRLVR